MRKPTTGAPSQKKREPPTHSPKEDEDRRRQALSLKVSGASDHEVARHLGYPSTLEAARDLERAYQEMSVLEPEHARKLHVARICDRLLKIESALSNYLASSPRPRERLAEVRRTMVAEVPLLALLARVEGTLAPTRAIVAGRLQVESVSSLNDHELVQLLNSNGVLVPELPPAGGDGGVRDPEAGQGGGEVLGAGD